MTDETKRSSDDLGAALRQLFARLRATQLSRRDDDYVSSIEAMSAPAFRALVAERLRSLERDVAEVRSRVNGLLFVVAGAVVTQLVLRLFG